MMRMNSPYYKTYTTTPSLSRSVREIPVQFVGSEKKEIRFGNRSEPASKIQKVLRGYLVRKSVKKIAAIRAEVEEIEKRMSEEDAVEFILRDSKERLRINEMLMNLLFKLDSVRGVDSGVRDYRKAVIKRVIAIQERLDSVAVCGCQSNRNVDQTVEDRRNGVDSTAMEKLDSVAACDGNPSNRNVDPTVENHRNDVDSAAMETLDSVVSDRNLSNENVDQTAEDDRNVVVPTAVESTEIACADQTVEDYGNNIDQTAVTSTEIGSTDEAMKEDCTGNSEEPSQTESGSGSSSSVDPHSLVEPREKEHDVQEKIGDKVERYTAEERLKKREMLLEKMVEENEKMMDLMAQMFERNAMQTRLLNSLSQRVEQLERAYLCDRLRRRKKRQAAAASGSAAVDGGDDISSLDVKKCSKR